MSSVAEESPGARPARTGQTSPSSGEFSNEPVPAEAIFPHADVDLEPISARYAVYAFTYQIASWVGAAALLWLLPIPADVPIAGAAWGPGLVAGVGLLAATWAWVDGRRRAFKLREQDILYARGLLVRRLAIVPITRIQHVETASGPLERWFSLERLTCFTAGGLSEDVVIRSLESGRAQAVRDYVLARIEARTETDARDGAPGNFAGAEAGDERNDEREAGPEDERGGEHEVGAEREGEPVNEDAQGGPDDGAGARETGEAGESGDGRP